MTAGQFAQESSSTGEWKRQGNRFTGRITRDSRSAPGEGPDDQGPDDQGRWPVEPGRYRLVVSLACPWAHRSVIVRRLLGLEDAISLAIVDPIRDERGWRFTLDPDGRDPVLGIEFLSEAYLRTDPSYDGRVTVPAIIDTRTGEVVTNDYPQITLDFSTEWTDFHREGAPQLIPPDRAEMDELIEDIYRDVNNGVYRCGFATSQEAYEAAYDALFARLDVLEERLSDRAYLLGGHAPRGRRPPLHHPGPLRRGLPRPFQVQPPEADRVPPPVGLRPPPLPTPVLRRDGRLRPDQAPLLRHPRHDQPHRHRPQGPGPARLDHLIRGRACP